MTAIESCVLLADVTQQLADARSQVRAYRQMAQAGIHHAHSLQLEVDRLRRQNQNLRDELRRYTAAQVNTSIHVISRAA